MCIYIDEYLCLWWSQIMTTDSIDFGPFPETRLGYVLHDSGPFGGTTGRQSQKSWPYKFFLAVPDTSPVGYPLGFGIGRAYHIADACARGRPKHSPAEPARLARPAPSAAKNILKTIEQTQRLF